MRNSFLLTNNIQTLDFFTLYRSAKLKEGEEEVAKIKARSFKFDDDIFVGENCYLPKAPSVHSSRTYRYHVMLLGPLLNSEINLARTLADPVK